MLSSSEQPSSVVPSNPTNETQTEAVQALTALGYGSTESLKAVRQVYSDGASVEDILREALKKLL